LHEAKKRRDVGLVGVVMCTWGGGKYETFVVAEGGFGTKQTNNQEDKD